MRASRILSRVGPAAFLLALTLPFLPGCRADATPAAHSRDLLVWRSVGAWSGQTSMQTESFLNESGALRIRWETRNQVAGRDGIFQATFHSAVSGRPLTRAVDSRGSAGGTAVVPEDPRPMYVAVEARGIDWHFTVEEGFAGEPADPR